MKIMENFEILRKLIRKYYISHGKKIIIGAGNTRYKGWVSTNRKDLDVTNPDDFKKYWKNDSISAFLAEHVWEHLTIDEVFNANKNCYSYLVKGGSLRIAVPDGFHPEASYIENVRPGGTGLGADDHKTLYNFITMSKCLKKVGFHVELLEYWDELGRFLVKNWDHDRGFTARSSKYDRRNIYGTLKYTSLIVDAIKPGNHGTIEGKC
jgi:predicted SAM-dependent methyltransferase